MIDEGKRSVLGVLVDSIDYEAAVHRILLAARESRPYSVSALAVHGVMTGFQDREHAYRLNHLDLVTPDGQPVRWALNWLHGLKLPDRVTGPVLMLALCRAAENEGMSIYLYGSTKDVLERLEKRLRRRFPQLRIAGTEPSKFRTTTLKEKREIVDRIEESRASIVFVGLGCPRQEVFAYEYRNALRMPLVAVGAAFDIHAGILRESPQWVERAGLQWAHRLAQEPRRLWRRYLLLNPQYMFLVTAQKLGVTTRDPSRSMRPAKQILHG